MWKQVRVRLLDLDHSVNNNDVSNEPLLKWSPLLKKPLYMQHKDIIQFHYHQQQ